MEPDNGRSFHTSDDGVSWHLDSDGDIMIDVYEEKTVYLSSSDLHNMIAVQTDLESAKEEPCTT